MSSKSKVVKRTIRYGVITAKKENKPVALEDIFKQINNLDFENNERYLDLSDGIRLAVILNNDSYPIIEGMIGDSRAKELPVVETQGDLKKLNLEEGSGLFDANHFIIYLNSNNLPIIIYEFNIRAPRIERLSQYLMAKFHDEVDYVSIDPINSMSIKDVMKNIKLPSRVTIRAHNSCSLLDIDKNLDDLFSSARNVSDCDYITVSFSKKSGRKEPVSFSGFENIATFMNSSQAKLLESFKIEHKNEKGINEEIELLDLFLHDKINLPTMSDDSRFLDSKKVFESLKDCKLKQEKIINGVKR